MTYYLTFFYFIVLSTFSTVSLLVSPIVLELFIKWLQSNEHKDINDGIYLLLILFSLQVISTLLTQLYFAALRNHCVGLNRTLTNNVYETGIEMTSTQSSIFGTGRLLNLVDQDIPAILLAQTSIIPLILLPVKLAVCIWLLYRLLGSSIWLGLGVYTSIVLLALMTLFTNTVHTKSYFRLSDDRIRGIREVLLGIGFVKLSGVGDAVLRGVGQVRKQQLQVLVKNQRVVTIRFVIVIVASTSLLLLIIVPALTQQASVVFPALTILAMITGSTDELGLHVGNGIAGMVAIGRVREYIKTRVTTAGPEKSGFKPQYAIELDKVAFKYHDAAPLPSITLRIDHGSLTLVRGRVGVGKSSLLLGLLSQLTPLYKPTSFSYAPQTPWIFSGTMRENITFSDLVDSEMEERLNAVVQAAGLVDPAFSMGVETQISEEGGSMSGGQAARISLARALYRIADVYLLDDVFAALDESLGRSVFRGVKKFLNDKTVVLVSSRDFMAGEVDRIIVMKEDGIVEGVVTDGAHGVGEKAVEVGEKMEDVKFGEVEEAKEGFVSFQVYLGYFRAGGANWITAVIACLVFLAISLLNAFATISLTSGRPTAVLFISLNVNVALAKGIALAGIFQVSISAARYLHIAALEKLVNAPMKFFENQPVGRILNRLSGDVQNLDMLMIEILFSMLYVCTALLTSIVLIIFSSLYMIGFVVIFGFIYYRLYISYQPNVIALKRKLLITKSPLSSLINQTIEGKVSIVTFGLSQTFIGRQRKLVEDINEVLYAAYTINIWISIKIGLLNSLITLAIGLIGIAIHNPVSAASIALGLTAASSLTDTISQFLQIASQTEQQFNAAERLLYYINELDQESTELMEEVWPQRGSIEFKNLFMSYPSNPDKMVLKNINIKISAGEKIGIVGRTGSGKSSILAAIFRTVEHFSGSIEIDGKDISGVELDELRGAMSIVPQKPCIFTGTIRSNLCLDRDYPDDELWTALGQTCLSELISSLPGKLDAKVESQGSNFSKGQIQLLCFSRALLRKSKILVLDEATSASDLETQHTITKCVERLEGVTVLCIAHRLETLEGFDKVLVLSDGTVSDFK